MKRKRTFTIVHGLAVSTAIHGVIALPFLASVFTVPPEEPPLEIELEGMNENSLDLADTKHSELEQKRGDHQNAKPTPPTEDMEPQPAPPPEEEPPMDVAADDDALFKPPQPTPPPTPQMRKMDAPPPAPAMTAAPDENNVTGANEEVPDTRKVMVEMTDQQYSRLLMKKVRENIVYPDEARRSRLQGVTRVTFVILPNGDVRPDTLKVLKSSGEPVLDAGALNTIRHSAPFAPPPREMALSIDVFLGEIDQRRR